MLAAATIGAIIGDSGGYLIGYYGGWPFILKIGAWLKVSEETLAGVRESL